MRKEIVIVKPLSRLNQELDAKSFTVVGGPAAEGLGAESMQALAAALTEAEGDFIIVLGDVSPQSGSCRYPCVAGFIDRVAKKPVYVVPGGQDGPGQDFAVYFGQGDSALLAEDFTLIMLNNSGRSFSETTLAFFRDTLAIVDTPNIAVAFHTPPPNRVSGDSLTSAEWNRFEDAAGVWRKKITHYICRGGGGYFEDNIDGVRLVAGGGGGRRRSSDRLARQPRHVVEFTVDSDRRLSPRLHPLSMLCGVSETSADPSSLETAYIEACLAQAESRMDAEETEKRGHGNLARLLRASAESRLRLASNLRRAMGLCGNPSQAVADSLDIARRESSAAAADRLAATEAAGDHLAAHIFRHIGMSEKNQAALFEKAAGEITYNRDIARIRYYVCLSCGLIQTENAMPIFCPLCGAPGDMLRETR